ncbi:MAG TPA: tRNA pseudouridine(55) synthase TruB [Nevskiaceae bacterium]|nr:tRNA pseudouridine(55) synthase TruB [Nevskiaceae bacterium]
MSDAARRTRFEAVDGILLLDKPEGLSSNAALQRVRRALAAEKGGHTGSLDPLATGLLPICLGRATRVSGLLLDADKRYEAVVRLGSRTRTGDREGEVVAQSDPAGLDQDRLRAALPGLTGPQRQIPPMYSALKREGQPLYALARAGQEVEREARAIVIHALELRDWSPPCFTLAVRCSKGTYIRTLAEDLAGRVGQCAHLQALRRTGLGGFDLSQAVTLDEVEVLGPAARARLLPVSAALSHWNQLVVDADGARRLAAGQAIGSTGPAGAVLVLDAAGQALGLAERDGEGRLQPRRWGLSAAAAP